MFSTQTDYEYKINIPMIFNGYEVIKYLDNGSSSAVIKVKDRKSKQYFAAKVISKKNMQDKNLLEIVYNEIDILQSVNHPNIIKLYNSFEIVNSENEKFIVMIEEYCKNGNLVKYLNERGFKNMNEKKKIGKEIVEAIQYLHGIGIVHRDIKLDNVLIDENHCAKLCDFGFSVKIKNSANAIRWGTTGYNSPELYYDYAVDFIKCDIWSLGITLYAMSEIELPYKSIEDIDNCVLSINTEDEQLRIVVEKCTIIDPILRPNANDLLLDKFFTIYEDCFDEAQIKEMKSICEHKYKTENIFQPDEKEMPFKFNIYKLNYYSTCLTKSEETEIVNYDISSLISCYHIENEHKAYININNDPSETTSLQKKTRKYKKSKNNKNKKSSKRFIDKKAHPKFTKRAKEENDDEYQHFIFIRPRVGYRCPIILLIR